MNPFKNAKVIQSCGSSGIFIDGALNEDFEVTNLEKIKAMLNKLKKQFELEYIHDTEYGDGLDEWVIYIK